MIKDEIYGSLAQIAERLGVSKSKVRHWHQAFGLPMWRETPCSSSSCWITTERELQAWIASLPDMLRDAVNR